MRAVAGFSNVSQEDMNRGRSEHPRGYRTRRRHFESFIPVARLNKHPGYLFLLGNRKETSRKNGVEVMRLRKVFRGLRANGALNL
jgi:hypothetical protein